MLKRRGFGLTAQALRESSAIPFTSSMAVKLIQNGKKVFQKIFARQRVKVPESKVPQGPQHNPALVAKKTDINGLKNGSLFNQFVYRSYIKSLASELRRRAALQFQRNGQNLPIFAFVGLAMTQNNNDCKISSSIRDIFSEDSSVTSSILGKVHHLSLDAFEFGGIIGKGCNSVVYEARLNSNVTPDLPSVDDLADTESDVDSDITILSASEEGEITVDFDVINGPVIDEEVTSISGDEVMEDDFVTVAEEELDNFENKSDENGITSEGPMPTDDFDLGIKMMFNYDVESRADSIYRAMQKESVPARIPVLQDDIDDWQNGNCVRLKRLPPHPNIVDMLGVFVAPVPVLDDAQEMYPAALPKRINEDGFGRNMTMFVVMKKYSTTLRQYLTESRPDMYTRCLMLGQLLEGILHLQNHDIAHRDLKSDNILINDTGHHQVELVICDFGCCLSEQNLGLQVPYVTADTDKGGNSALMAPEIASAVPGTNVILDYSKSDLWAVGTLMYELFGMTNPFYRSTGSEHRLDSRTYQEADLPSLPEDVPEPIKRLAYWILKRDPKERPSPLEAATIFQLYLSFPDWLAPGRRPCFSVMAESLLVFGAEAVLRGWHNKTKAMTTEDILKLTFLRRINLDEAYRSLKNYHTATRFCKM